uniref:Uncharacterized protein n=1 Tax=viral metagenome TaxID=1070528 RepID=A0A6H1ZBS4_9ZZZZ
MTDLIRREDIQKREEVAGGYHEIIFDMNANLLLIIPLEQIAEKLSKPHRADNEDFQAGYEAGIQELAKAIKEYKGATGMNKKQVSQPLFTIT